MKVVYPCPILCHGKGWETVGLAVSIMMLGLAGCAMGPYTGPGLRAAEDARGPWWMQQTAMTRDGKLSLKDKPWWERAAQLKVGEQFVVEVAGEAADRMLVRREKFRNNRQEVEAVVWVIDDDGDGSLETGGDRDSDCYIADYGADGVVDRMVDYIDSDGDNDPDEMDIRYFVEGELRQVWCGMDLDDDSAMWDLAGYEYSANFFRSDPYGNNMIYMNKFDPRAGEWLPISECPFAFYDTDGDGQSEEVVRFSAVPLAYDNSVDPDYANDARRYRGQFSDEMRRMGVVNIRYSFDVDHLSSKDMPLHYDYGFNLVGARPYQFPGMYHYHPKRRPPQVTCVIPFEQVRPVSDRYAAKETGFSWHEQHDDTTAIGDQPHPEDDWRWEGVFWIWERRFMENTGGPNQRWNVRREWSQRPADRRELYYSAVDRRIHLFGAEEGWIQIGHFNGLGSLGEMRMYDTDGNGYFDRWEVYLGDSPVPVRVTSMPDTKVQRLRFNAAEIAGFYTQQVLPEAMSANAKLMAAMSQLRAFSPPAGLQEAMKGEPPSFARFAQDVARELQYQDLRQHLTEKAHGLLHQAKQNDLRGLNAERRRTTANSQTAWQMVRALERLDVAYGQGDYAQAEHLLAELAEMQKVVK